MPLTQAVAVKSETDISFTLAGWACVFDTPESDGADLVGDYFDAKSDLWLDKLGAVKPLLYNHGTNKAIGKRIIGQATLDPKDEGVWFEAEVAKSTAYAGKIRQLIDAGLMGVSIGSVGHLIDRVPMAGKNYLAAFPAVELSLTVHPAEPRVLGIAEVKALLAADPSLAELLPSDESETKAEEAATPTVGDTTAPVVAEAVAPAASEVEATEPAVTEIPTVDQPVTEQAPAAVAAVDLNTNPDATANTAIKALETQVAALVAKLNDEPAVKAGGIALPAIHLKADTSEEVKAFELWIRTGIETPAMKAALNVTTAGQGGYAVPVQYSNELVVPLTNLSYLRRAGARIVNFSGTEAVHVPSLTFTSAAILTAEANAYSEVEPTMGEVVFVPYKYTRIAKASEELAADSRFDLWGQILMPDFAQAFAQSENTAFTSGTGSSQPQGIVYGTSTGVTTASASAITADEVIQTFFALDYKYRDNAKWMMADSTVSYVRRLKDGQGNYLWNPGLNGSTSGELLGKPIVTNNSMDAIAASKDVALFADFSYFWIGNWPGLSMQRLNELYAASGQIGWRAFSRFDSHLMLSAAATKLTTHS